jgi:hypothetical protein
MNPPAAGRFNEVHKFARKAEDRSKKGQKNHGRAKKHY